MLGCLCCRPVGSNAAAAPNQQRAAACAPGPASAARAPAAPASTAVTLLPACRLRSRSSAVKLGSESVADMRHISFARLAIEDSNRGLAIQLRCPLLPLQLQLLSGVCVSVIAGSGLQDRLLKGKPVCLLGSD